MLGKTKNKSHNELLPDGLVQQNPEQLASNVSSREKSILYQEVGLSVWY